MDPRHRFAAAGLAHERDDGRQHQHRLEPFAQQDQQRAEEGGGRSQPVAGEFVLRAIEQRVDARHLRLHRVGTLCAADRVAQRHHLALDFHAQRRIDVVEAAFDQLEALEVGGDRGLACALLVAARVELRTFVELAARECERRRTGRRQRLGMRGEPRERRQRLGAVLRLHLGGRRADQILQRGEGLLALASLPRRLGLRERFGRLAHRCEVERECPALVVRQLLVAAHRGAGDAQRHGVVQPIEAAHAHAIGIVEVGRRRIEPLGRRAIAAPVGAVATRAVGVVQAGRVGQLGRCAWRDREAVRRDHVGLQPIGRRVHRIARGLGLHLGEQGARLVEQLRARRVVGQLLRAT